MEVRRRTRRRAAEEGHEGEGEKNCNRAVQIFVKVDGMKTVLREVSPEDKVQKILNTVSGEVIRTCEGRMPRKDDELKSCGVSDGCTIQVMSRMRGGGKHKVKTSKAEKKRDRTPEKPEQTRGQEGDSQVEHNTDNLDDNSEAASQEIDREKAIKQFREQGLQPTTRDLSEGSDEQVEDNIQQYLKKLRDSARLETEQLSVMDEAVRWAVEAERKGTERERCKNVRFGGEEQSEETGAQSTDEPEVTSGFAEVRTGRGSAGLIRGGRRAAARGG